MGGGMCCGVNGRFGVESWLSVDRADPVCGPCPITKRTKEVRQVNGSRDAAHAKCCIANSGAAFLESASRIRRGTIAAWENRHEPQVLQAFLGADGRRAGPVTSAHSSVLELLKMTDGLASDVLVECLQCKWPCVNRGAQVVQ